jgi:hypothetical protein
MAVWCGLDEQVHTETCGEGTTCGWDDTFDVYGCVDEDPCGGVDSWGACDGETATWCHQGEVQRVDCGECGRICGFAPEQGGVTCQDDPCEALGPAGRCSGDVLTFCDESGEIQAIDCGESDLGCAYDQASDTHYCG